MAQRFGIGYDVHPFGASRPLVLGGVTLEHDRGLEGHSDADAVAHALIDALLGAAALGDIGRLFPDSDQRWRNVDSMALLADVRDRVAAANYRIVNVDVTVVTETPKLAPYVERIRGNIAGVLRIPVNGVSVKAKTNERMDAIGQGRGLMALAVASIQET